MLEELRKALTAAADQAKIDDGKRVFKEDVKLYGVKFPLVNKLSKQFFPTIEKPGLFSLCDELWQSGYLEEAIVACNWSYYIKNNYEPADFEIFEKWLNNYVSNWAACDTLCNHSVGEFLERFPQYSKRLKDWARSDNRWVRRGAAVSFIIPARKGFFINDIFDIANILLNDEDDLVRKGYGWMLKAASEAGESETERVFEYVMAHKTVMPRVALRYAIEKMPADMKKQAMAK